MDKKIEIPKEKIRDAIDFRVKHLKKAVGMLKDSGLLDDLYHSMVLAEDAGEKLLIMIDKQKEEELPMTLLMLSAAWIMGTDNFIKQSLEQVKRDVAQVKREIAEKQQLSRTHDDSCISCGELIPKNSIVN